MIQKALLMKKNRYLYPVHGSSVKVNAVSVNPVDTKLRQDNGIRNALRILGFDGVGKVVAVGDEVQKFSVGDRVFYAGTTTRAGSNQEYQLVDERIVALAPKIFQMKKPQPCR